MQPANAEVTPEKSRPAVVVPEMPGAGPGTGEKLTRPGILAQQQAMQWMPARHPGEDQQAKGGAGHNVTQQWVLTWVANNSGPPAQHLGGASDSQEVAELKRRNQVMEDALRDALTTGEGAGMFARLPPVG